MTEYNDQITATVVADDKVSAQVSSPSQNLDVNLDSEGNLIASKISIDPSGVDLNFLNNVNASSPVDKSVLYYDASSGSWRATSASYSDNVTSQRHTTRQFGRSYGPRTNTQWPRVLRNDTFSDSTAKNAGVPLLLNEYSFRTNSAWTLNGGNTNNPGYNPAYDLTITIPPTPSGDLEGGDGIRKKRVIVEFEYSFIVDCMVLLSEISGGNTALCVQERITYDNIGTPIARLQIHSSTPVTFDGIAGAFEYTILESEVKAAGLNDLNPRGLVAYDPQASPGRATASGQVHPILGVRYYEGKYHITSIDPLHSNANIPDLGAGDYLYYTETAFQTVGESGTVTQEVHNMVHEEVPETYGVTQQSPIFLNKPIKTRAEVEIPASSLPTNVNIQVRGVWKESQMTIGNPAFGYTVPYPDPRFEVRLVRITGRSENY